MCCASRKLSRRPTFEDQLSVKGALGSASCLASRCSSRSARASSCPWTRCSKTAGGGGGGVCGCGSSSRSRPSCCTATSRASSRGLSDDIRTNVVMWVMFAARSRAPIAAAATTVVRSILRDGLVSEEQGADRGRHDDNPSHKHSFRSLPVLVPVKTHRGEPGLPRDTRTHKGTRTAQTNITTIQTHQQRTTRTSARRPKPRPTQEPQARSRPPPAADSEEAIPSELDPASTRSQSASPRLLEGGRRNEPVLKPSHRNHLRVPVCNPRMPPPGCPAPWSPDIPRRGQSQLVHFSGHRGPHAT